MNGLSPRIRLASRSITSKEAPTNGAKSVLLMISKSDLVIFQVITPLTIIVNSTIVIIAILSALIALNPNVAILTIIIFGTIYTLILLYKKK